ncbi:MAG: hypothetical protein PHH11_04165 [Methylomonas sp.]|nr:hypothetical protein [Methylomonas sp.]
MALKFPKMLKPPCEVRRRLVVVRNAGLFLEGKIAGYLVLGKVEIIVAIDESVKQVKVIEDKRRRRIWRSRGQGH